MESVVHVFCSPLVYLHNGFLDIGGIYFIRFIDSPYYMVKGSDCFLKLMSMQFTIIVHISIRYIFF